MRYIFPLIPCFKGSKCHGLRICLYFIPLWRNSVQDAGNGNAGKYSKEIITGASSAPGLQYSRSITLFRSMTGEKNGTTITCRFYVAAVTLRKPGRRTSPGMESPRLMSMVGRPWCQSLDDMHLDAGGRPAVIPYPAITRCNAQDRSCRGIIPAFLPTPAL